MGIRHGANDPSLAMATRMQPHEHLKAVSADVVGGRCYPKVQSNSIYPSLVYHMLGVHHENYIGEGPGRVNQVIRVEVRGQTFDSVRETYDRLIVAMRKGRRLVRVMGGADDYTENVKLHRYIFSLVISY